MNKELKPFAKMCCSIGNIPTSYTVSMSYEEQLLWLCNYLENTVIPAVNDNTEAIEELQRYYQELKYYVDHYFDDLNIQEEINNKLDAMALDGTLAEIINEEIFSDLNDTINEVKNTTDTIEPIVYDNEKNIKFPTYNLGIERIFRFLETDSYKSLQGMCITPNNTIICTLWEGGSSNNDKIVEINYNTGEIVKTATFSFGYANGITYDTANNLVYIIPRGEGTGSANLKTIKVLNYDDFSFVNTYIFDDYIQSVYYDKDNEEIYLLSEYGLRSSNGFNIYKVDNRFNILDTISLDYSEELNNLRVQNFAIKDNYIYIISSDPKSLIVYNIDGSVYKKYTLNEMIDNLYYSGEYQDIDFLGNQCYISSADNVSDIEGINQLFKIDFNKDYISSTEVNSVVHNGYAVTLYVDSSSNSINPDGSSSNKFKSINEALRYNGSSNIMVANGTYNGIDIRSKSNTNITGDSSSVIIKGIKCTYNSNISLDTLTINDDEFNSNGYINLYETDIYIKNVTISGNKYGIYVGDKSKCKLSSGVNLDNITSDNQIYVRSESVLFTPSTYYNIEKHNESATIVGGIKLFETDRNMVVGEFSFDNNMNYIFNNNQSLDDFFKEIAIIYEIGNNTYQERFPLRSSNNPMQLGFDNMSSGGTFTCSRAYVDIHENKFRIRFSRVGTTSNTGATTVVTNDDNTNYAENSIIVKNCILY